MEPAADERGTSWARRSSSKLKETLRREGADHRRRSRCVIHERMIMLSVLDGLWKDHLLNMDHLKEGIGLRGYGAAGSAGGLQEGILRHVRGDDGALPGRHGALTSS